MKWLEVCKVSILLIIARYLKRYFYEKQINWAAYYGFCIDKVKSMPDYIIRQIYMVAITK